MVIVGLYGNYGISEFCKMVDNRILLDEREILMVETDDDWGTYGEKLDVDLPCWTPEETENKFLNRFLKLFKG